MSLGDLLLNSDTASLSESVRDFLSQNFWSVKADSIAVEQIKGGITNLLYHAWVTEQVEYPHVLVRIYGKAGSMVIDRECEEKITGILSSFSFGPRILGYFKNGRLEEFFPSRRPLEAAEMIEPHLSTMIADKVREMHSISCADSESQDAYIWSNLQNWLHLAEQTSRPSPVCLKELASEIQWAATEVKAFIHKRFDSALCQLVLAHNDLLGGNILYCDDSKDLVLIDFEYASLNFAGFDIANHFCAVPESALISQGRYCLDKFPSSEQQMIFLRRYLRDEKIEQKNNFEIITAFRLLAELRWIVWAVVQAEHSAVVFDYDNYAKERFFNGYLPVKQLFSNSIC